MKSRECHFVFQIHSFFSLLILKVLTMSIAAGGAINGSEGSSDNLPSQYKVLTLAFNQDFTALAMGTVRAYSLFAIDQNNRIDETHNCGIEPYPTDNYLPFEEVRIIERLFSSSLIALVTDQAPRKLTIFHFRKGREIGSHKFPTTILAVKMNRLRLIVCSDENIWIYDVNTMKVLHTIRDIKRNPDGLCALSPTDEHPYLAYPGSAITGEIHVFDTMKLKPGVTISAHEGPLAAMSFDMSGTRIATASNKGTVIRVHSAVDGSCLFEFRRGVRRAATIYSLAFSPDSMFLAASSNTETIHIFRLTSPVPSTPEESSTWMGSFGRILGGAAYYLPKQTSEVLTQDRSFATVHLQSAGVRTTIAMNVLNRKLILYVAGYDGMVFAYEINTTDGGECSLNSQYLLFNVLLSTNSDQNAVGESGKMNAPSVFKNDNKTVTD